MKKRVFLFIVLSIIASIFTGCQSNTEGETTSKENGGFVTSTDESMPYIPIDASLNLDLDMFKVLGKPIGDWTYEALCDYISANYEEIGVSSDPTTGAKVRTFSDGGMGKTFVTITEGHSVYISEDGVTYNMFVLDWCRSCWSLSSCNEGSNDIVDSICGQRVEDYLESICPGLYDELLEEPTVYLKDGVAMMDSQTDGYQRISLSVIGATLDLGYQDGVITSLTVIFTE